MNCFAILFVAAWLGSYWLFTMAVLMVITSSMMSISPSWKCSMPSFVFSASNYQGWWLIRIVLIFSDSCWKKNMAPHHIKPLVHLYHNHGLVLLLQINAWPWDLGLLVRSLLTAAAWECTASVTNGRHGPLAKTEDRVRLCTAGMPVLMVSPDSGPLFRGLTLWCLTFGVRDWFG